MTAQHSRRFRRGFSVLVSGAGMLAAAIASAEDNFLTEGDFLSDIPVVSGASHFPQKLSEAPASVTIIDQEMIRASGALELVELFRLVPGFQAYYVRGGQHGMAYHTLADEYPKRLEVKVDGRSIYESIVSTVEWTTLGVEMEDIDYIEVIRSPNAPADGSNAFTGTVNIVTKTPVATKGWSVRAEGGDLQTRNTAATYSDQAGDFDYRATVRYRSNDGFPAPEGTVYRNDTEAFNTGFRGLWTPNLADSIDVQLGYAESAVGLSAPAEQPDASPRDYRYHYQYLNWQRNLNDDEHVQLLLYHNALNLEQTTYLDIDLSDWQLLEALGMNSEGTAEGKSERYDMELRHDFRPLDKLRIGWGGGLRYDAIKSEFEFDDYKTIHEEAARLFTNVEYSVLPSTVINAGIMLENNSMIDTHHSARFGVNQHLNSAHTLRASVSRASRSPSVGDYHWSRKLENENAFTAAFPFAYEGDIVMPGTDFPAKSLTVIADVEAGNDLYDEAAYSYEIGYYGEFRDINSTLDIKVFAEEYKDFIDNIIDRNCQCEPYDPSDDDEQGKIAVRSNNADLDTRGVEMQLTTRAIPKLLASLQYAYLDIDSKYLKDIFPPSADGPLYNYDTFDDAAPQHIASLLLSYSLPWNSEFSTLYYYQTEVDWSDGNLIDDFDRLDLRLSKSFQVGATSGRVELIGHNVFGSTYYEYQHDIKDNDHNAFDTRYYARVIIDF